jgi:cell wall-associated NlpC family hydrolase
VATRRPNRPARLVLGICVTTTALVTLSSSFGYAEPTKSLAQVEREVNALHRQAEQATERYNAERIRLQQLQKRIAAFQTGVDHQAAKVAGLQRVLGKYADVSFRMGSIDPTLELLFAEDPEAHLRDAGILGRLTDRQVAALENVLRERRTLDARKRALDGELAAVSESRQTLLAQKREIDARTKKAEDLLDTLEAEERAKLDRASRTTTRVSQTYTGPATGDAKNAVDYAYAQLGKPYQYAAAGPDAFDCSGLTMMAWRQAGVSLPHQSQMQYDLGPSVAKSDLRPGDLVYFYSPISHVGIYVGNGKQIHATHPGDVVSLDPIDQMPWAGATRPGG